MTVEAGSSAVYEWKSQQPGMSQAGIDAARARLGGTHIQSQNLGGGGMRSRVQGQSQLQETLCPKTK